MERKLPSIVVDQDRLERVAAELAGTLQPSHAVLLAGPMGAGKTTFARALLRAACRDPYMDVPSPTFTLVQTYEAPDLVLHHFDLWRLTGPEGLPDLGWDDARTGVVLVEWPDRLGDLTPVAPLIISLAAHGSSERIMTIDDHRARMEGAAAVAARTRSSL